MVGRCRGSKSTKCRYGEGGSLGTLSTHDLALTEIAGAETGGVNVHMGSRDSRDPMDFNYRLKPGVTKEANAWRSRGWRACRLTNQRTYQAKPLRFRSIHSGHLPGVTRTSSG